MNKEFLINCDDLGMHPTINDGICDLLDQGIIKSTSIMATGQAFDDAIKKLKQTRVYSCGVHLTLNSEYPNLPTQPLLGRVVSSLCESQGSFFADPLQTRVSASMEHVKNEFCAQIEKVAKTGVELTHIDGHMFCYDRDVGGEGILEVAKEVSDTYGLPMRTLNPQNLNNSLKTNFIWEDYDDHISRSEYYRNVLGCDSTETEEIIIHPAKDSTLLSGFTSAGDRRISDYLFFSSQEFKDIVSDKNLRIVNRIELNEQP